MSGEMPADKAPEKASEKAPEKVAEKVNEKSPEKSPEKGADQPPTKSTSLIPGGPPAGVPRVVLITGASSGFGKALAKKLLSKGGMLVYCAARRLEEMADLEEQGAKLLQMDVTDDSSVKDGVTKLLEACGRIDVLVANAGYGSYGMIEATSMENIKAQFEVNVYGVARCIQAVLPQMREQKHGRIVLVTSVVAHLSILCCGWYAATKHALLAVGGALRQEVKGLGIEVAMIEPGFVKTGFADRAFAELEKNAPPEDYVPLQQAFVKSMKEGYSKAQDTESTATAMTSACCDKKIKNVYKTTTDSWYMSTVQAWTSESFFDKIVINEMKKNAAKFDKKEGKRCQKDEKDITDTERTDTERTDTERTDSERTDSEEKEPKQANEKVEDQTKQAEKTEAAA